MSKTTKYLTLNKNTLKNWNIADEDEIKRSKKVLMSFISTLTKVDEKNFESYRVSATPSANGDYGFVMISPLKKVFTLVINKDLQVVIATHITDRKFVPCFEKDMQKDLPLCLENGYNFCIGNKMFAVTDSSGEKTDLTWVHQIPLKNGEKVDIESNWTDVDIGEEDREGSHLQHSKYILYNPPVELDGKTWQRVINIICDDYGYWDVKYFLVDCVGKTCIDLNASDHYHGMGSHYAAIWIEENKLIGYRYTKEETVQENVQLYPPEENSLLCEAYYKQLFPMSTGIDGRTTFSTDINLKFDTSAFLNSN